MTSHMTWRTAAAAVLAFAMGAPNLAAQQPSEVERRIASHAAAHADEAIALLERSRARMREIVGRHLPQTSAEIEFDTEYYPAMTPTEGNARLLAMLDRVSRDLGHGPVTALDPAARGAGDIAFVSSLVDSLDGLGPVGEGAHSEKESLDLTSIPVQIARAAVLIHRLTAERQ
jgi:di/tripeptidase